MRAEIGSEFWNVPVCKNNNHVFDNVAWFVSGRAALRAILHQIIMEKRTKHLKAALPSYLCESMIQPFELEGIDYIFYSVDLVDGSFHCNYSSAYDCDIVLVLDYFGFETTSFELDFKQKIIIRDLTHSVFIKNYYDADYYFGSLRKWAGFLCGGFAVRKNCELIKPVKVATEYISLRSKAMKLKEKYIYEEINSKQYLNYFHNAEIELDKCEISTCDLNDIDLAMHLDIDSIKRIRRRNAKIILDNLKDLCLINEIGQNDCPLFVPILYKHRDELKRYLLSKEIYCPSHWPKPKQINNCSSNDLYDFELSIVCDQRYSEKDMLRIVDEIHTFMENKKEC